MKAYLKEIHQIVMMRLIKEDLPKYLDEAQMEKLANLAAKPSEMEAFLRAQVPNLDELITRQTLKLKEKLLKGDQDAGDA
ncbi:MAG: hypothetical protein ABH807_02455 [Candidatus Shapirobacteria bacterium]